MEPEQKKIYDPEFISYSRLLNRGLTEATIRIFIDPPDKEVPNPHYRNGSPMKLYSLERIKKIEETEEFRDNKRRLLYR